MRFRTCPLCGSKAVGTMERFDDEDGTIEVTARCGDCGTWRTGEVGRRAADALERRLRRDLEKMVVGLGQHQRWRDHELEDVLEG
jgi:ribosome-binding protein aMBF1 (putative translation factor)